MMSLLKRYNQIYMRTATCLFLIAIGIFMYGYISNICNNVTADNKLCEKTDFKSYLSSDEVLRLHVIAQGDDLLQQTIKMNVKDSIIREASRILKDVKDTKTAIKVCQENLDSFEKTALETLKSFGHMVKVNASMKKEQFPSMGYGNVILFSDEYITLKTEIGEAKGTNWWCVLFPSLCLVDLDAAKVLEKDLSTIDNGISVEITTKKRLDYITDRLMTNVLYDINRSGIHISQARSNFELPKWILRMLGISNI